MGRESYLSLIFSKGRTTISQLFSAWLSAGHAYEALILEFISSLSRDSLMTSLAVVFRFM